MEYDLGELSRTLAWKQAYERGVRDANRLSRRKRKQLLLESRRESHVAFENWYSAMVSKPHS